MRLRQRMSQLGSRVHLPRARTRSAFCGPIPLVGSFGLLCLATHVSIRKLCRYIQFWRLA